MRLFVSYNWILNMRRVHGFCSRGNGEQRICISAECNSPECNRVGKTRVEKGGKGRGGLALHRGRSFRKFREDRGAFIFTFARATSLTVFGRNALVEDELFLRDFRSFRGDGELVGAPTPTQASRLSANCPRRFLLVALLRACTRAALHLQTKTVPWTAKSQVNRCSMLARYSCDIFRKNQSILEGSCSIWSILLSHSSRLFHNSILPLFAFHLADWGRDTGRPGSRQFQKLFIPFDRWNVAPLDRSATQKASLVYSRTF